ncbi:hypothetical protein YA0871_26380 [Pseudomonas paralactis]|uniref:Uncharacterized protein n=1 Tax=Pseudomonas paralactis TaxID=1615673 RepID=A0ABS0V7A2_9PSED|nr:hypothetical protein [Pseudomonas paralactis]MBI6636181.1 hypothetical protein [Pseudomonas paralactis]
MVIVQNQIELPAYSRHFCRCQRFAATIYLIMKAALMELALQSEKQGMDEVGDNVRGALFVIDENAGHIKQRLAKL